VDDGMNIALFYHSLVSDWNHGNAHFLRGIATELIARGHRVRIYEPEGAWSVANLIAERGPDAISEFHRAYPALSSIRYEVAAFEPGRELEDADLVIVHEWNDHELVRRIGRHRRQHGNYILLFHDTHHRSVTKAESMKAYDLREYDGVLAYGNAIRQIYLDRGWARSAWTWHEAADTRIFKPLSGVERAGEVVWIGNWGDGERTAELHEFLIEPVKALKLSARVYGVRYSEEAVAQLARGGIEYAGWLPNFEVPRVFAAFRATVHVPRQPYVEELPGIPTIRPFEALACGIPLVSAPWHDVEGLFRPGYDFLLANNTAEMTRLIRDVLNDPGVGAALAQHGRETVLARHTCAHRVDELMQICASLEPVTAAAV
jgi:spore maturation protein CgeB